MTIQYINTGTSANKGDGDTLRSAFTKINDNFRYLAQSSGFINTGSSTILSISPTAPSTATDGSLWFSSIEARTFVRYNGAWVDASPQITPPPSTSTETVITMSAIPPDTGEGTLWFNINDARTYINYSGSWVDSSPQVTPPPILPANDIGLLANDGLGNLFWTTATVSTGSNVDLTGYATEVWVNSQGFITSSSLASLSGIEGIGTGGYFVTAAGSSNYIINGQNDPPLQLIRGYKYTFNINAPGHPFFITTVNGGYNPANVYSKGVTNNGTMTGVLTFTVPVDAPNTLYYVCQFHSAMIGPMSIVDVDDLIPTDISELSDNTNLLNSFTSTDKLVNGSQILTLTSTGTTVTPGSMIPIANLSYDLGSPTNQWRSLYVGTGTIFIGGVPLTINTTSNTLVIGTSTNSTASVTLATEEFVIGSRVSIVNGDNSLAVDGDGNVIFQGDGAGNGVNRGLEWDYGAEQDNGTNSTVRQDSSGLSVKAWTTGDGGGPTGGGENGNSATVNIRTNQGDNEKWWVFDGAGDLTLPAGGTIAEGIVTDNPTIELTPAGPDTASQKLVIKGGNAFYTEGNGIGLGINSNVWSVGDTVTIFVYSNENAGQTLYWWIYPEVLQGSIADPGTGTVVLDEFGNGDFSFELDSDDYEFTVRVSPVEGEYYPDDGLGLETVTINDGAGSPDAFHLHLTTGDLEETSIFLGTDEHNVRTRINGSVEITAHDYANTTSSRWQFNKDSELILPENIGGSWAALDGPDPNNDSDTEYRAVAVGPDGAVYAGGRRDGYPTITKISAAGDIVYSKVVTATGEGPIGGRVNSVEYSEVEGSPILLVMLEIYSNYAQSVVIGLNPATGLLIGEFATFFAQDNNDFYITEAVPVNTSTIVFAGSKNGSFVDYPVTAQTGSTTGTIIINRSDFPPNTRLRSGNSAYQITGTGIVSFETLLNVNLYTGLTGTVREGSGATFDVTVTSEPPSGLTYNGTDVPGINKIYWNSGFNQLRMSITSGSDGFAIVSDLSTALGNGANAVFVTISGTSYKLTFDSATASFLGSGPTGGTEVGLNTTNPVWTVNPGNDTVLNVTSFTLAVDGSGTSSYNVTVANSGTNYLVGHKILIDGSNLGGSTSTNDLIIEITGVDSGNITTVSFTGTATGSGTYTGVTGTNYNVGSGLQFDLSYFSLGYADGDTTNYNGGSNYAVGDVITILGTSLGGTTPTNDMTITVNTVDGSGAITGYGVGGVAQTATWKVETSTPVDFTAEGSWTVSISYARESFLTTFTGENSIFFGLGNPDQDDRLFAVAVDGLDIYAIGESWVSTEEGSYDAAVIYKFSIDPETTAFNLEWARVLNEGSFNHEGKSVAVASDGVYATMVGYGEGSVTGLVKLDKATGDILWQKGTQSGDDSSVVVDPDTGLIWVAVEGDFYEPVEDDAIKLIAFDSTGTVQDRRWLARTGDDLFFKNGRCLRISGDYIVVVGYSETENNNTPFVFRVPKAEQAEGFNEGEFLFHAAGDYDVFDLEEGFSYTVSPQIYPDSSMFAGPVASQDVYYDDYTDARTFEEFDSVKSAIVFGDGTRMETAPVQERGIPQNNRGYNDYTLTLADNGKHIFHPGNGYRIYVPAHEQLALPIGYTVTLITKNDGTLYIEAPDYYDINDNQYYAEIVGVGLDQQGRYWTMPQRSIATLIKVEEGLWYLSGPGIEAAL